MNIKVIGAAVVLFAAAIAAYLALGTSGSQPAATSTIPAQTQTNSSKVLFSTSQYAHYAYQIYPGPISGSAMSALAGFNLTTASLSNGTTQVGLTLLGSNTSAQVMVSPGYKLYFIETTFGDDGYHFETALGDDGYILVDQNGYIAQ